MHSLELILVDSTNGNPIDNATTILRVDKVEQLATTDGRGVATLLIAEGWRWVTLRVKRAGYLGKLTFWTYYHLPSHLTLKMDPATMIGGFIRNDLGEPVTGAQVLATVAGPNSHAFELPSITDSEGRWMVDGVAAKWMLLVLKVLHPDHVSDETVLPLPAKEELKNGTAVITLPAGFPCEGNVTDIHGQPLEGVEVSYRRVPMTAKTNAEGHYRFASLLLKGRSFLTFRKEGFAPELVEVPVAKALVQNVVLSPGESLRVRFVDEADVPIAGAVLKTHAWRGHRSFEHQMTSDNDGLATWDSAPADAIDYTIIHDLYFPRDLNGLSAAPDIQLVKLDRKVVTCGRVIDAQTREPIKQFTIALGRFSSVSDTVTWGKADVCSYGAYVAMDRIPLGTGFRRIQVEALGYDTAFSPDTADNEARADCHFELVPTPECGFQGIILDLENRPLSEAKLFLLEASDLLVVRNREVQGGKPVLAITDGEGRYSLPSSFRGNPNVLVIHPSGYAIVDKLRDHPEVQIRAWGRLVVATSANPFRPAPYYLHVQRDQNVRYVVDPIPQYGDLVYEGLPPGQHRLGHNIYMVLEGEVVNIENGETTHLDLLSGRRAVVGQIEISEQVKTALEVPGTSIWLIISSELGKRKSYQMDPDGSFRLGDLLLGKYTLTSQLVRPAGGQEKMPPEDSRKLVREFELVAGEGEHDLGTLSFTSVAGPI